MLKIGVILGTIRQGRFGEKPARWILGELNKHPDIEAELLDLRDYPMPFFDEPVSPGWISEPYKNEVVALWTKKIGEKDGYVIIAPEYNRSFTGVLKNAIDWVYREWNKKVFGFVSSGLPLGSALTPVPFGFLIDQGHPELVFALVAGLLMLSLLCVTLARAAAPRAAAVAA